MTFPTCQTAGPRVHLSVVGHHDGVYSVQVSDGRQILIAYLEVEEWAQWLSELPAVTARRQRAAVVNGTLMIE